MSESLESPMAKATTFLGHISSERRRSPELGRDLLHLLCWTSRFMSTSMLE